MKLSTHIITGLSVALVLSFIINKSEITIDHLSIAMILSFILNSTIDYIGHRRVGRYVFRSVATHEVLNNIYLSLIIGVVFYIALYNVYSKVKILEYVIYSIAIGLTHLILDYLTINGIYVRKGRSIYRVRSRISRRYDDYYLNGIASIFSSLVILIIIYISLFNGLNDLSAFATIPSNIVNIYK